VEAINQNNQSADEFAGHTPGLCIDCTAPCASDLRCANCRDIEQGLEELHDRINVSRAAMEVGV